MYALAATDPPNVLRLVEDMTATLPLFAERHAAGRLVLPSAALLAALGQSYLDAGARVEAFALARDPGFVMLTQAWYWPTGVGDVHLSYFLAGVVLARRDVWAGFRNSESDEGKIDWPRCLQWLVMHGVTELRLAPFLHRSFVAALQTERIETPGGTITPLGLLVLRERPELLSGAGRFHSGALRTAIARWADDLKDEELKALFGPKADRSRRPDLARFKQKFLALKR